MTCNTIQTKLFYEALNSLDQQLRSLLLMKSFLSVIIASIYSVGTPHRKICDLRECIDDNSYEETMFIMMLLIFQCSVLLKSEGV